MTFNTILHLIGTALPLLVGGLTILLEWKPIAHIAAIPNSQLGAAIQAKE